MNLKSFIQIKEVKNKFAQEFLLPNLAKQKELLAPPQTTHYALIGTAFDYLMRFYIKKLNPSAIEEHWVAELALTAQGIPPNTLNKIKEIIEEARKNYSQYLKHGEFNTNLIQSTLSLAQLDAVYRIGYLDPNLGNVDGGDIKDLQNLIQLADPKKFLAEKVCILNPRFEATRDTYLKADADIVLDDLLIDIKVTKYLELKRDDFNQIIGYWALSQIGKIEHAPPQTKIERIGIYYARHGILWTTTIDEISQSNNKLAFLKWFKEEAKAQSLPDEVVKFRQ